VTEPDLRVDPLTGALVIVTPWRQDRPNLPGGCPFCPGGLEASAPYDLLYFPNRWPGLPGGRHEVVVHSPDHHASFSSLGEQGTAPVVELWSARTAALAARNDVGYVFVFENRGRAIGATIDHPHSQILGFSAIPPVPRAELAAVDCTLCPAQDGRLVVEGNGAWVATVPWAPSWPYEMVLFPHDHVANLPDAGERSRGELAGLLVASLRRMERLLGADEPYMLWFHQRPADGAPWPNAHVHAHVAPVLRGPGVIRHLAAAEFGAGVFFDPVDPFAAADQLRRA
jgi:UDPglucose--hexose-1-phosphate uridylyltransferase